MANCQWRVSQKKLASEVVTWKLSRLVIMERPSRLRRALLRVDSDGTRIFVSTSCFCRCCAISDPKTYCTDRTKILGRSFAFFTKREASKASISFNQTAEPSLYCCPVFCARFFGRAAPSRQPATWRKKPRTAFLVSSSGHILKAAWCSVSNELQASSAATFAGPTPPPSCNMMDAYSSHSRTGGTMAR